MSGLQGSCIPRVRLCTGCRVSRALRGQAGCRTAHIGHGRTGTRTAVHRLDQASALFIGPTVLERARPAVEQVLHPRGVDVGGVLALVGAILAVANARVACRRWFLRRGRFISQAASDTPAEMKVGRERESMRVIALVPIQIAQVRLKAAPPRCARRIGVSEVPLSHHVSLIPQEGQALREKRQFQRQTRGLTRAKELVLGAGMRGEAACKKAGTCWCADGLHVVR
eukprot:scaffold2150_cov137-Isochrysis_galbana.AAC.9